MRRNPDRFLKGQLVQVNRDGEQQYGLVLGHVTSTLSGEDCNVVIHNVKVLIEGKIVHCQTLSDIRLIDDSPL